MNRRSLSSIFSSNPDTGSVLRQAAMRCGATLNDGAQNMDRAASDGRRNAATQRATTQWDDATDATRDEAMQPVTFSKQGSKRHATRDEAMQRLARRLAQSDRMPGHCLVIGQRRHRISAFWRCSAQHTIRIRNIQYAYATCNTHTQHRRDPAFDVRQPCVTLQSCIQCAHLHHISTFWRYHDRERKPLPSCDTATCLRDTARHANAT